MTKFWLGVKTTGVVPRGNQTRLGHRKPRSQALRLACFQCKRATTKKPFVNISFEGNEKECPERDKSMAAPSNRSPHPKASNEKTEGPIAIPKRRATWDERQVVAKDADPHQALLGENSDLIEERSLQKEEKNAGRTCNKGRPLVRVAAGLLS